MQFPSLCIYHNATYNVTIRDENDNVVYTVGPITRHWREGDPQVVEHLRDAGLQLNHEYSASISVSTLSGVETASATFGERDF
jgi:hypothetical protein